METFEITTPIDKNKLKLKKWITGRDSREIDAVIASNVEVDEARRAKLAPDTLLKSTDKSIELVVVEINGSDEDILKKILDMKCQDYDFVVAEVEKVVKPPMETSKKN